MSLELISLSEHRRIQLENLLFKGRLFEKRRFVVETLKNKDIWDDDIQVLVWMKMFVRINSVIETIKNRLWKNGKMPIEVWATHQDDSLEFEETE